MIERLITFIALGFFVFVADFGEWTDGLLGWHGNFVIWALLILACYYINLPKNTAKKSDAD